MKSRGMRIRVASLYISFSILVVVINNDQFADHAFAFQPFRLVKNQQPSKRIFSVGGYSSLFMGSVFFNDFGEDAAGNDDDDDDDSVIDPDSLGDWRTFRRNLASESTNESNNKERTIQTKRPVSVSRGNEEVLKSQSKTLAAEYMNDLWAHEVATVRLFISEWNLRNFIWILSLVNAMSDLTYFFIHINCSIQIIELLCCIESVRSKTEVGGLMVRMPLEVEIHRSFKHTMAGSRFRKLLKKKTGGNDDDDDDDATTPAAALPTEQWYKKAQIFIEEQMLDIASRANENDGQIDASTLKEDSTELLQLYLDNQETWQEVCLVLERNEGASATSLVLNRPMALKLTENLAELVLYGAYGNSNKSSSRYRKDLVKFLNAFGEECAVYIGGPHQQEKAAIMIHGIADLPGAAEISPGCGIYCGGIEAAIQGVVAGQYKPLDFRFFVGRHTYEQSAHMDLAVVLGKYQPIACTRALALKQCLSLPKPLWHEVLELCGGEMEEISRMEMLKRDDLKFEIVEDSDDIEVDGVDGMIGYIGDIPDELDELGKFDDDDDDDYLIL